jgi:RNA 3'-terminal phosphate cyclase (ATP)
VLRQSVALAQVLGRSVRIQNIRAKRPKPGLARQHLTGLELVRDISGGSLAHAMVGSCDITYIPGSGKDQKEVDIFEADIRTAGSICLLVQIC